MGRSDVFGRLAQQIGERLQDASQAPGDVQKSIQGAMRSTFDRLDLVSREDFDVMMEVLQRTRTRVEALEKQVITLEKALSERDQGKAGHEDTDSTTHASVAPIKESKDGELQDDDVTTSSPKTTTRNAKRKMNEQDAPEVSAKPADDKKDTDKKA
ncbi:accessory factor UbiK family protein [Phytohalomonas tamaricis]|uniref:accessory factor UbiK family protein n=1 Tax=Phytohalomonas tamaricis TaxID=2081032 RepID=UPI000D0B857B